MTATTSLTTRVSLRGRIHEYGPRLEHAPTDLVYVGRRCTMGGWRLPESKLANPFTAADHGSPDEAVRRYREYLLDRGK